MGVCLPRYLQEHVAAFPDGSGLSSHTDKDLLEAHLSGDQHAFTDLIRRHYDYLWHIALRTCMSGEDAADSLQEAMLAAHRNAGGFRGDSSVRTWLHTIVVNACLDRLRRNRVRPTVSLAEHGHTIEPADRHDRIAEFETRHVLEQALATLPAEQRLAVVAVDVEGYSVSETARLLGVAEGTIKSRCARARVKLAERLGFLRESGNRT
jgi:RNA polymerase sigma-70 factor, ECF subfamily